MSSKSVCFLLPGPSKLPVGGYKMIFEYANRLICDGVKVHIVYAGSLWWSKKSLRFKITNIIRYIQKFLSGFSSNTWFSLNPSIQEHLALSLNFRHVPKADIYICTTPVSAQYLNSFPIACSRKFYFIQGYENWGGISDEQLRKTYRFKLNKIVVSRWLSEIVKEEGEYPEVVPNGFDLNVYSCRSNKREFLKISMVYSPIECKGFKYGWDAIKKVKERYPEITVEIFGTEPKPYFFPDWVLYNECPDINRIVEIYSTSAIFVASSIQEGWGLTVGEAMLCGAAVVCSNNLGYLEMAEDGITALVSPVKDSDSMANNIERLINDESLRTRIAETGRLNMRNFDIENSYRKFKAILNL